MTQPPPERSVERSGSLPADVTDRSAADDPKTEIGCALFFSLWAAAGWWYVAGDSYLWTDFGRDPGPGLMPVLVLTILSIGSLALWIRAARLWIRYRGGEPSGLLRDLLVPTVFTISVLLMIPLMYRIGFVPTAVLFAGGWMLFLNERDRAISMRRLVVEVAFSTAIGVGLIYAIFVRIIHVPLP